MTPADLLAQIDPSYRLADDTEFLLEVSELRALVEHVRREAAILEREACAQMADPPPAGMAWAQGPREEGIVMARADIAANIRARRTP